MSRFFIREETVTEIEATTAQEALAIWLDKGYEASISSDVYQRDVYDADDNYCSVEEP